MSFKSTGLLVLMLAATRIAAADDPSSIEFFEKHIRPVLVEHCVDCHGPDTQESKLRVDHISFLRKQATYGYGIVPGKPGQSLVLRAMAHEDADLKMPDGGNRLPTDVVSQFRRWIEAGAVWPDEKIPGVAAAEGPFDLSERKKRHPWIWTIPKRQALPKTSKRDWAVDRVDHFILSALERNQLAPAPPAEAGVWLRRTYFTIIGLPPTPAQIESFYRAADKDLRAAKLQAVDQLLASPHFGERWARHWMDLVRYAESRGHESDFAIANAWRYRDYLIRAFNDDVPYDLFVKEHLAGDLLSDPRIDPVTGCNLSILGTGWAFLGEEVHSPVDIRQDELERVDNKVDVLSKTFLGLTVACARCHDHKFDAISQQDYYAMSGFVLSSNYRQVRFETIEHHRKIVRQLDELVRATRKSAAAVLAGQLRASIKQVSGGLASAVTSKDPEARGAWHDELKVAKNKPNHPLYLFASLSDPAADSPEVIRKQISTELAGRGARAAAALEGYQVLADYRKPDELWLQDGFAFGVRPRAAGTLLIGTTEDPIAGISTVGAAVKDPFWDDLTLAGGNEADSGSYAGQARSGRMLRTSKVTQTSGRLHYLMRGGANVYAGVDSHIMVTGPLHQHLLQKVAGDLGWHAHDISVSDGHRVYVQFGAITGTPLEIHAVVEGDEPPSLIARPNHLLRQLVDGDFQTVDQLARGFQVALLKALDVLDNPDGLSIVEREDHAQLVAWMIDRPRLFPIQRGMRLRLSEMVQDYLDQRQSLKDQVCIKSATAVSWMDGNGVDEQILTRGKHSKPAGAAPRRLPASFSHANLIVSRGSGRAELAHQVVDPQNPLTARVMANRIWHHVFGRGIVATVDNFGWLGERPSHPELLDDLAWSFQHHEKWSVKRLIRRLVLSQTFAMSSHPHDVGAEAADPKNMLLHRMPVRRLEAEAIRDAVLAVSGRLDRTTYGPPVPVHLTEFVIGRGSPKNSGPLDGDGRRAIYTAARRNFIPTFMTAFDYPTPFTTVGRRDVTNVPAQSLALMNDPLMYAQSDVWAKRSLDARPDASDAERIRWMYLEAFARPPGDAEIAACADAIAAFRNQHDGSENDAWRDFCHALLSVNEFIYLK